MELSEAKKYLEELKPSLAWVEDVEAINTVLQELEKLQKENHRLKNWKQYKEIRKMRRTDEAIEKARKYFAEKELLKGEWLYERKGRKRNIRKNIYFTCIFTFTKDKSLEIDRYLNINDYSVWFIK